MRFDDGEQSLYVIRKHWIVFFGNVLLIAISAVLPALIMRFIPNAVWSNISLARVGPLIAFAYFMWLLFLWIALAVTWTMYYLNVWIVTNTRVIDIHQKGLFSRELLTARLEKIQDVTIDTEGLLQTIFGFGTITIETAGEDDNFIITNATHPEEARKNIMGAHAAMLDRPLTTEPQDKI